MVSNADFVSKSRVTETALNAVRQYKKHARTNDVSFKDALGNKKLIVSRMQNAIVQQLAQEIRQQYRGETYRWLPSDASEPDPLHQLNYGRIFQVGVGEMPGDRYGCRCAMELLVNETSLKL
jgi:hypothetical protein